MRKANLTIPLVVVFLSVLFALHVGAVRLGWDDWLRLKTIAFSLVGSDLIPFPIDGDTYVLWYLRIPRVLLAVLIGGCLGLSGTLVQGLFRNPLSDPSLLGVTTGAACAAALTIVMFSEQSIALSADVRLWLLPFVSFSGALMTCLLLNASSRWLTPGSIAGLLLLGIALNALGVAVIGLCTYFATDEQLRSLSFWTLGSLAGANWFMVLATGFILICAFLCARTLAYRLNALSLGDVTAAHLGVVVTRLRWCVSVLVALLAGLAVAFCGVIGFVGLIAPHLARTIVGSDQRVLAPFSVLFGALLMLAADTLARTVAIPAEIPVGIFTALLGGPFLIFLLRAKRHQVG